MTPVAVALGSNLGDRERTLRDAANHLTAAISDLQLSSFHQTEPVDVGRQPLFLNAAAVGSTSLTARQLLAYLFATENLFGRVRPHPGAPRTLDLDLIFYDGAMIDEAGLIVPHPRFRERRFVLAPLSEIAADWIDPITGKTVQSLLAVLGLRSE